jgi:hypothetical protein
MRSVARLDARNCCVPGLAVHPEFVDAPFERELIAAIDAQPWSSAAGLKRRVQHYGFRFDYATRSVDPSHPLGGGLPHFLAPLLERIASSGLALHGFDQVWASLITATRTRAQKFAGAACASPPRSTTPGHCERIRARGRNWAAR